jgi:hypothetical protein
VLVKDGLKPFVFPVFRRHVVLDEVVERLDLDVQKVRIVPDGRNVGKALPRLRVFKVSAGRNITVEKGRHKLQDSLAENMRSQFVPADAETSVRGGDNRAPFAKRE